jgi:hypothetical protein
MSAFLLATATTTVTAISWLTPQTAQAQTNAKDPEIVEAKQFAGNQAVARVTVRSPKPVNGTLRCDCSNGAIITTRLELPTGGEKTVWLPLGPIAAYEIRTLVWDIPGSKDPSSPVSFSPPSGGSGTGSAAMAVLPSALGARKAPNTLSARGRGGSLDVAELSVDDVEQRGWVLEGFSVVATTSKELNTLSNEARLSVFDWVSRGGELLIDDDDPIPLIGKQPTATRNAFVGRGIVRRTSNATRTGQWETVMLPARNASANIFNNGSGGEIPISLRSAVKFAPVGALLAGLLVYALATGPVAYSLGRKRNKPLLMWIAVPLASVLTTAAVLAIGIALRRTAHDQYVVFTSHGVADHTTIARAVTEGSGAQKLKVPLGWTASSSDIKLDVGVGITSSVDLRPGQIKEIRFGGSTASSPAPFEVSLVGDQFTIKNVGNKTLTNVTGVSTQNGQIMIQSFKDIAAGGSISELSNPTPYYFNSFGTADDRDAAAITSLVQSNGIAVDGSWVIVAETAEAPTGSANSSGIPNQLTSNAKYLRSFHAITVQLDGPRLTVGPSLNQPTPTSLHRYDLGAEPDGDYVLAGIGYDDKIWIGDQQMQASNGPLPDGAIQNGVVLVEGQNAVLELAR